MTNFNRSSDTVKFTVRVPSSGAYNLYVGYASEYGDKGTRIGVVGQPNELALTLKRSASFTEANGGKIFLEAGENTVKVIAGWGYYDLDFIRITSR